MKNTFSAVQKILLLLALLTTTTIGEHRTFVVCIAAFNLTFFATRKKHYFSFFSFACFACKE